MLTTRQLERLDGKPVRAVTTWGEIVEGECSYESEEYLECELGFDEDGLQIADYILLKSQIAWAEEWKIAEEEGPLRAAEIKQLLQFSLRRSFSENMKRWEDNEVPDKYDHNAFEYVRQPSRGEFLLALEMQTEREDAFIKLEGRVPLEESFGLEESAVLTMVLEQPLPEEAGDCAYEDLSIRQPLYRDLKDLEIKNYGSVYGEDLCGRMFEELYEFLEFRGAYLGEKLVGSYHYFTHGDITLIDGLMVDSDHRNKGVATALIRDAAELAASNAGKSGKWVLALHADRDDTPRRMYEKLGFVTVDTKYEYLCRDIAKYRKIM